MALREVGCAACWDKRSDGVRKGLAKTFAFRKKDKDDGSRRGSLDRPMSSATVRPGAYAQDNDYIYEDARASPAIQIPQHNPQMQHASQPAAGSDDASTATAISPISTTNPTHGNSNNNSTYNILSTSITHRSNPSRAARRTRGTSAGCPLLQQRSSHHSHLNRPVLRSSDGSERGRPVGRWNKLRKDPELWDPNGDVLVFLGHRGQSPRPQPSFRLSSHIIEATESRFLLTMLREGFNEEDFHMPPSPAGAPPMIRPGHHPGMGMGVGRGRTAYASCLRGHERYW